VTLLIRACYVLGIVWLGASTADASLVSSGLASGTGAGIGTSNVVLTIQNTPTEQGCVRWSGTADIVGSAACPGGLTPAITGGDEKTGNEQTQTRTVTQVGVTSGENLVMVLNVSEPGGTLFTVENLSLSVLSASGSVLFNSGSLSGSGVPPAGGNTFNSSLQTQSSLGFAFTLDAAQASAIDAFICTNGAVAGCGGLSPATLAANAGNRIGLAALLTNDAGGNETFSVADAGSVVVTPIPEPETLSTLALGLLALTAWGRRRPRSSSRSSIRSVHSARRQDAELLRYRRGRLKARVADLRRRHESYAALGRPRRCTSSTCSRIRIRASLHPRTRNS